jgi:hypothetical protein
MNTFRVTEGCLNEATKKTDEYKAVMEVLQGLNKSDLLERLNGFCVAASEVIQNMLDAKKIRSKIVECQAIVTRKDGSFNLIGYDRLSGPPQIDTHFVVLIEGSHPFIVDASVGYLFEKNRLVILSSLAANDPEIIAQPSFEFGTITYRTKKEIRYPQIHEKSLIRKVSEEGKIRGDITLLQKLIYISLGGVLFNVVANSIIIGMKITGN